LSLTGQVWLLVLFGVSTYYKSAIAGFLVSKAITKPEF
jgi:hypothetical protein